MLDFGWQVATTDDPDAGTITGAAYDPQTRELVSLVVRRGAIATRDIVVPTEHVESAYEEIVTLRLTADELEQFDDFRLRRYVSPELGMHPPQLVDPPGVVEGTTPAMTTGEPTNPFTVGGSPLIAETTSNVPEGAVPFSQDQEALTPEGEHLGKVAHLVYEEDQLVGVVVRPDGLFGSGKLVTLDLIEDATVDELVLDLDHQGFRSLGEAPVA